jgi:hypothetical protein
MLFSKFLFNRCILGMHSLTIFLLSFLFRLPAISDPSQESCNGKMAFFLIFLPLSDVSYIYVFKCRIGSRV